MSSLLNCTSKRQLVLTINWRFPVSSEVREISFLDVMNPQEENILNIQDGRWIPTDSVKYKILKRNKFVVRKAPDVTQNHKSSDYSLTSMIKVYWPQFLFFLCFPLTVCVSYEQKCGPVNSHFIYKKTNKLKKKLVKWFLTWYISTDSTYKNVYLDTTCLTQEKGNSAG